MSGTPRRDCAAWLRPGVLYRHCFAPATWTIPSHASLFTGLYPWEHGCDHAVFQFSPEQYYTLPEILKQSGYHTVAMSSDHLICPEFNFHTGFDQFHATERTVKLSQKIIEKCHRQGKPFFYL
jgi:arylsulfatase A-like enzyme